MRSASQRHSKGGNVMQIYGKSDIGMMRSCNQDAFDTVVLSDDAVLSIVCDGMGGANAGNIASKVATDTIKNYILRSYSPKMSSSAIENLLRGAVDTANVEVFDMASGNEDYKGMGTTVVVALVVGDTAHILHVGDSRAYLVADEKIEQITRDHSLIQDMLDNGEVTAEQAKLHPKKNIITRAVGILPQVDGEYNQIQFTSGVLLSCTDGLSGMLSADEILQIVLNDKIDEVPDRLIDAANNLHSNDNVTVTVVAR
ncbi:MAG: Stp1/IreP family PP2C-type Ser/Thr phosphatase [Ruminococcaceae bacterium]|nr:Stp1/IreP family PP2C-type Ser/Thr phosphatase [Oscillospiraceae bacterium]